jgi:hypothetical protein
MTTTMVCTRTTVLVFAVGVVTLSACERAKSANPLSPDVAGPLPGVNITAPKTLEPLPGQQLVNDGQPQTLLIENAGSSGPRDLWLEIEVAADAGFQRVLHQASRVTPGPNGRTQYRMPEPLGTGNTYYWRVRAQDGANIGPYSSISDFSIIDPVTIEAPTPMEPSGNLNTNRPDFKARNGRVSGPAGNVVYRFEIATSPDPSSIVAVVTAPPDPSGVTTISLGSLPYDRTLYWRVWATDGTTQSPFSGVLSFKTPAAPAPPPAPPTPQPPSPGNPGSGGPSPVPSVCAGGDPFACVSAVAAQSAEWARCASGSGVGCHRFTRQVVYALSRSDPNWKLIMAAPGGHACNCSSCGPSDGSMFREDTAVYAGSRVFDMIVGAGGPSPSLTWNQVPGPRPGDIPADAPVCNP